MKIIVSFLFRHPVTRKNKLRAAWRFLKWQFGTRMLPYPVVYPFIENSKLIVEKGMAGATGNVYAGLHEFEDMGFMLHYLRPGDNFADVGANVGGYTILASAVAGANTISIEPIPSTFRHLRNNVQINEVERLVNLQNVGVGSTEGFLRFTKNDDTVNHVVQDNTGVQGETIEVPVRTLDQLCGNTVPVLMKMDVEGFELEALKGAANLMRDERLQALIVELNATSRRYGVHEKEIHEHIVSCGFTPCTYEPFSRKLEMINTYTVGNTIYVRNEQLARQRTSSSRKYRVLSYDI